MQTNTEFHNNTAHALLSITTGAWALFFGVVFLTTISLTTQRYFRVFLEQDTQHQCLWELFWNSNKRSPLPLNLSSMTSVYSFVASWAVLGLILMYAFICEHYLPFPTSSKPHFDPDQFATWIFLIVGFSLYYGDNKSSVTSPQRQVHRILEEFKGVTFLLYALYRCYEHDDEGNLLPEFLFLALHTWWTSFRHFFCFHYTQDFGWTRMFRSLWTPCSALLFFGLLLAQRGNWTIYFLCFMEIMSFVVVYVVFRVGSLLSDATEWGLRTKCSLAVLGFYFIWDVPNPRLFVGIFGIVFSGDSLWEWYVLSTQYHWYLVFGMVYALNWPILLARWDRADKQVLSTSNELLTRACAAVVLGVASLMIWKSSSLSVVPSGLFSSSLSSSSSFNATMAFAYGPLIHTFLYLRTCTNWMRRHSFQLFEVIGKHAMEAYVLHNHVVLRSNGQGLVTLISPAWPKLNFLGVLIFFFLSSKMMCAANRSISDMLCQDSSTALSNVAGFLVCLLSSLVVSAWLHGINLLQIWVVTILTVACGAALYALILRCTNEQGPASPSLWSIQNRVPFVIGAACICLTGCAWQFLDGRDIQNSAQLSETCKYAVHQGMWFGVDVCNEGTKAYAFREHKVSSIVGCVANGSSAFAWGWQENTWPFSLCRIRNRDASTLLWRTLKHRNITFVGDSMVRHLYHATCRQVGHLEAGAYNTSMGKWSDFTRQYSPNTVLDFRWAPFTSQVIPIVQQLQGASAKERPDVLVVGGGAWDLLYNSRSEENRTALDLSIRKLAQELDNLQGLGQTIVWVEPTMINTWGLTTEDKRQFMREDQMTKTRMQYDKNGVLEAVSFVLNGRAFTQDRVKESYDGVHYPLSVYDVGSQILLNALDWVSLPESDDKQSLDFGITASPLLGLVVVALLLFSIICMDSLFGLSYLASFFMPTASPRVLYEDGVALISTMEKQALRKGKSSDHSESDDSEPEEDAPLTHTKALGSDSSSMI